MPAAPRVDPPCEHQQGRERRPGRCWRCSATSPGGRAGQHTNSPGMFPEFQTAVHIPSFPRGLSTDMPWAMPPCAPTPHAFSMLHAPVNPLGVGPGPAVAVPAKPSTEIAAVITKSFFIQLTSLALL